MSNEPKVTVDWMSRQTLMFQYTSIVEELTPNQKSVPSTG